MRALTYLTLLGSLLYHVAARATPAPPAGLVLHEKRSAGGQSAFRRMDAHESLPMRIALHSNPTAVDNGHAWLMALSDPSSEQYAQFWTPGQVIDAFKPANESVDAVMHWLSTTGGIHKDRVTTTANKAWLAVDVSVAEAESLLHTKYYWYGATGDSAGCDEYHLSEHLLEHIDYITPAVKTRVLKRSGSPDVAMKHRPPIFGPVNLHAESTTSLSNCANSVTQACLQALYNFTAQPPGTSVSSTNHMGVLQFGYYAQSDLDAYFSQVAPWVPNGTHPINQGINGGYDSSNVSLAGGETELDFEMSIPIIYPQSAVDYSMYNYNYADGGTGSFNTWLDALDGSYCSYAAYGETGDDPSIDPTYPDAQGYNHPQQCGAYKPANVISISWGNGEQTLPAAYQKRMCNEFMKLGMQGVSIFQASGDFGVAQNADSTNDGCLKDGSVFNVGFPNSCPYITSVGGTQIEAGKTVHDPEEAWNDPTANPAITYAGGGGFSNIYTAPAYQQSALASYFQNYNPPYAYYTNGNYNTSSGVYNRNGRGLPDVSANANNITVTIQGQTYNSGGTSAATPIFAALINRIVEERIKKGKGPLGFLNPSFYQNPGMFNDVTIGTTAGCGTNGFAAVPGWDPATGLGTPNYPKMLEYYLSLP